MPEEPVCMYCQGPFLLGDQKIQGADEEGVSHLECYEKQYPDFDPTELVPDKHYPPGTEEQGDYVPETCEEALAAWDAGESVFTVEMGGIGPSYEQQIHIVAFELVRLLLAVELPLDDPQRMAQLEEYLLKEAGIWNKNLSLGLSGAQAASAVHIALMTKRHGWRAAVRKAPAEDRILVCKVFP